MSKQIWVGHTVYKYEAITVADDELAEYIEKLEQAAAEDTQEAEFLLDELCNGIEMDELEEYIRDRIEGDLGQIRLNDEYETVVWDY